MNYFMTQDHAINLDQVAYLEIQQAPANVVRVYFCAVASTSPEGDPVPLTVTLRGRDATLLLDHLRQNPGGR